MALDLRQKFVSAQYLENKLTEFHQILFLHPYWQDLAWDCYSSFSPICTRVMALYLRQNFVSAQCLENKRTEFHQILYMHLYWQDLPWDCYASLYAHLYLNYTEILFPLNILKTNWQNFTKFYICIYIDKI